MHKKVWQQTPDHEGPGIRILRQYKLYRGGARLICKPTPRLQLQTRCIISLVPGDPAGPGFAGVQQARIQSFEGFGCSIQFTVFQVPSWEARLYIHEPSLYHHFSFPVLYGKGQKITAIAALKLGKRFTLEGRCSATLYQDREQIGTGNEQRDGSGQYDAGMQLRLDL